jgi:hypothetical protein
MTKIFPALLVPVALKFLPGRRAWIGTLACAALVTIMVGLPSFLLGPTYFIASYRVVFSRSAWETVWAIVEGYFSYGRVAPLGVRFDPTTTDYAAYPSRIPTLPITVVTGALFLWLWLRPVARTARNIVLFTAISMLGFTIILPTWRRALWYTLGLSAVNTIQWPLYHEWFDQVPWVLGIAVVLRTLILIALVWEFLAELWSLRNPLLTWRPSRRMVMIGATVAAVLIIATSAFSLRFWASRDYDTDAMKPAFDFATRYENAAGGRPAYIFTSTELYELFHPFFANGADFYLLRPEQDGDQPLKNARLTPEGRQATIAEIARAHTGVFLIRPVDDSQSRDLNTWLTTNANLAATTRVEETDLTYWTTRK